MHAVVVVVVVLLSAFVEVWLMNVCGENVMHTTLVIFIYSLSLSLARPSNRNPTMLLAAAAAHNNKSSLCVVFSGNTPSQATKMSCTTNVYIITVFFGVYYA